MNRNKKTKEENINLSIVVFKEYTTHVSKYICKVNKNYI